MSLVIILTHTRTSKGLVPAVHCNGPHSMFLLLQTSEMDDPSCILDKNSVCLFSDDGEEEDIAKYSNLRDLNPKLQENIGKIRKK